MAVMVTGATGFIGGHLVETLVEAGEDVRCLVRKPGRVDSPARSRFHVARFDRADLGVADSVFDGVDTVYHLAGATRATSEAAFHAANVAVTERLLDRVESVRRGRVAPRFVYISSQAAAGPSPDGQRPLTEDDRPTPIEAYGRSKLAAEQVVLSRSGRLPVTIVRPVAVYGPRDHDFLSIFRLMRLGLAVYPGIRDAVVNTIFVDDLVGGLIAAAKSPAAVGKTYFIGHPKPAAWREIYQAVGDVAQRTKSREINIPLGALRLIGLGGDLLGRVTGRPPLLSSNKAALAAPRFWTCSSDRARRDFGFVATTSLNDGLRATYDWYLRHLWL